MSTANNPSSRVSDIQVVTSLLIDENNNAATAADAQTPASGLFIAPSTVAGRLADVSGFLVTSENEYGKLEFSDPDGFLSLDQLSDVTITAVATNDLLAYNGTLWVNVQDIVVDSATVTKATVTIANFAAGAAAVNGAAGTITITDADLALATRSTAIVVTNTSVTATSVISLTLNRGAGDGEPYALVTAKGAGTFTFVVYSPITAMTGSTALDVDFLVT